jgi:hypothetical protein
MLPFLKKNQEVGVSGPVEVKKREPDEDSDYDYDMLESAAEDLISAVHSKDTKAVCSALRAAFQICDLEPHEEGPHE